MFIAKSIEQTRKIINEARKQGKTIGLVPTMGALHQGHFSLINTCRQECDFVVVSIFVNPTQFAPTEDLDQYPRPFHDDCQACRDLHVDLIFAPDPKEMYPQKNLTWIQVDKISEHLCGTSRPTHFQGVGTVVAKLFNITTPDKAYFGQKDAQQLAIIQRMVTDLNFAIEIRPCPIIRESDGLAMSSRNQYLDHDQRDQAVILSEVLKNSQQKIVEGMTRSEDLTNYIQSEIEKQPNASIDYISIVDNNLLQPTHLINKPVLIALAVRFGSTRLIDNIVVDPAEILP